MIDIVTGDILFAPKEMIICHQVNCVSKTFAGLAKDLFEKYPYANFRNPPNTFYCYGYGCGPTDLQSIFLGGENPKIGTVIIMMEDEGKEDHAIANMFCQVYPGRSYSRRGDTDEDRIAYFIKCLNLLHKCLTKRNSFAFPWKIGCGLAGGDWAKYLCALEDFSKDRSVTIFRREEDR